jgi:hypothetical protein
MEAYTHLWSSAGGMSMYHFGMPGHGKGPWDGIGGMIKHVIKTLVTAAQETQEPLPGLSKTAIDCAHDAYVVLKTHFESKNWRERNKKKAINYLHFECSSEDAMADWERLAAGGNPEPVNPIVRPVKQETFYTMKGITKQYQLLVVKRGLMYARVRPCWCTPCTKDASEGDRSSTPDLYAPKGCELYADAPEMYTYYLKKCHKVSGKNMPAHDAIEGGKDATTSARQITHGKWLMFWNEGEGDPLWLGRAVNHPEWEDEAGVRTPTIVNTKRAMKNIGTAKITIRKGECGVHLRWYQRVGEGTTDPEKEDNLQFVVSEYPPVVMNTKYMVHSDFDLSMCQMSGKEAMVTYSRRAATGRSNYRENTKGAIVRDYTTTEKQAQAARDKETWIMSADAYTRSLALLDQYLDLRA